MLAAAEGIGWHNAEAFYQACRQKSLVLVVCRGFENILYAHVAFPVALLNCQPCNWPVFMLLRKTLRIAETFCSSSQLMYFLSFLLLSCYEMAFEFFGRLIRTLGLCQDKPAGHQHLVLKVDGENAIPVSGPALWYSPDGLYFPLVSVLYLCCSLFQVLRMLFIFTVGCTISPATEEGLILPLQMVKCVS